MGNIKDCHKRAFITGGSGLVGHQCSIAFRAAGWEVAASHFAYPTPTTFFYDCATPDHPENFDVRLFAPDVIVHCAAWTHVDGCEQDPEKSHRQNVAATQSLKAIATEIKAKLVFVSSDYVFDGSVGPYGENAIPNPLNVYGKHKLESERIVLGAEKGGPNQNSIVLRITNVYGKDPGRNKNFVTRVAANLQKNANDAVANPMTLKLPSDQYATPTDAADVGVIAQMLVADDKSGIYHLAAPEYYSRVALARKVMQWVSGNTATVVSIKTCDLGQPAQRPLRGGLLSSRLESEYPDFVFQTVSDYLDRMLPLSERSSSHRRPCRTLPGLYAQYDQAGKHWYAPNKFEAYGEEEIEAVVECLRDGFLAPGPKTEAFERSVCELFGKDYGLMVNSGSSANLIALNAFGFRPGDEVVTAACTFSTVVAPLAQLGVTPVFVDVELGTYVPSVDAIIDAITPRTVMIWLPNLVGSKPDWESLRQRTSLPLWEDSCDTITKTSVTDVSTTSFYASHMVTAGGGGGMIMANDENFMKKCKMYRDWGRVGNNIENMIERFKNNNVDGIPYDGKFLYGVIGYNMKATEMNAAFGIVQLTKLPQITSKRRANFQRFLVNLEEVKDFYGLPVNGTKFDWLAFPLTSPYRQEILEYLESKNIQTRVTFCGNIARHPAYRSLYFEEHGGDENFPIADRIMAEGFLLGCHQGVTFKQIDRACNLLKDFSKQKGFFAVKETLVI
uniref:RmlD-like substrate binding domain-containing protein n=1 Tax=Ditylum brightwellii TaxID=49249 RepID=A0A6V2E289_9STRA